MKGVSAEPKDRSEERENWRTLVEAVDEDYFKGFIDPGMGALDGAGVVADATQNYPFVKMPDGVTGRWRVNLGIKPRWNGCGLYLKLYYSSDAASANTFNLTIGGRMLRDGTNLLAPVSAFSVSPTPAGPAAAQDVKTYEYVNAGAILGSYYDVLSIRIVRDGAADANNNELWLLGYRYVVLEPRA